VCGRRLTVTEEVLCAVCNLHLPRTGFQFSAADNVMARMFWGRIPVERAAALIYYEAGSEVSRLVYDLKYHDRPDIGHVVGRMMAREFAAAGFFEGIDCLVPIPLTRKRQRQRGYNQSLMLAEGVAEVTRLPIAAKAVRRTHFADSQTSKSRYDRQINVEHVFELTQPDTIRGKHVLLIDDVVTTGATMTACATELLKAGDNADSSCGNSPQLLNSSTSVKVSLLALGYSKEK
jgi:ComF family protein